MGGEWNTCSIVLTRSSSPEKHWANASSIPFMSHSAHHITFHWRFIALCAIWRKMHTFCVWNLHDTEVWILVGHICPLFARVLDHRFILCALSLTQAINFSFCKGSLILKERSKKIKSCTRFSEILPFGKDSNVDVSLDVFCKPWTISERLFYFVPSLDESAKKRFFNECALSAQDFC